MQNVLWQAVYDAFTEVDGILNKAERFATNPNINVANLVAAMAKPKPTGVPGVPIRQAYVASDELVGIRTQIRATLDALKVRLAEKLTEREVYLALFPIVVNFDEVVQNRFARGQMAPWPPLQKELFKIDDGGAIFYDTLEDLLRKPETLPFIYEIFYLCLSDGFRGKYTDNLAKVNEYKHKLEQKIPVPTVAAQKGKDEVRPVISFERVPISYYAMAAASIALACAALYALARA